MGRLVALLLALAVLIPIRAPAAAEPDLADSDRAAIRTTIERQLAAFQRDDGSAAFSYAAPSIKERFGTPENFMNMVRTGYEPVYRPREVEFGPVIEFQGQPTQLVLLVGQDLQVVTAYYLMEKQPDGNWRIDGCVLGDAPASAT